METTDSDHVEIDEAVNALNHAVLAGDIEACRSIAGGLDLNQALDVPDIWEAELLIERVLIDAVLQRKPWRHDMLRLLVELGADLNAVDRQGTPIIKMALRSGDLDFLETLLDLGARVDPPTTIEGEPVLDWVDFHVMQLPLWGLYGGFGRTPETRWDSDEMSAEVTRRQLLRKQHLWKLMLTHNASRSSGFPSGPRPITLL